MVGFHKVGSGLASLTWPQAVDEALCFGWIDGIRHRVDDARYAIRFTPRKASSIWSAVNIERAQVLSELGRMQPDGLAAFELRTAAKSRTYSYEQTEETDLTGDELTMFKASEVAWAFFAVQPPSYRKKARWWVASAKKPETRCARLAAVMAASSMKKRI